jgi:hypothetical protein
MRLKVSDVHTGFILAQGKRMDMDNIINAAKRREKRIWETIQMKKLDAKATSTVMAHNERTKDKARTGIARRECMWRIESDEKQNEPNTKTPIKKRINSRVSCAMCDRRINCNIASAVGHFKS